MSRTQIAFSDIVGRRIRLGSWEDQKVSTYRRIGEAIDKGAWDDAAALAHYFVDEASTCFAIYRHWFVDLAAFLRDQGVEADDLAHRRGDPRHARAALRHAVSRPPRVGGLPQRHGAARRALPPRAARGGPHRAGHHEGDVAPGPRPRRRPCLRAHERGQRSCASSTRRARRPIPTTRAAGRAVSGSCSRSRRSPTSTTPAWGRTRPERMGSSATGASALPVVTGAPDAA